MDKLKILFLQDSPCIRNYKYARALRARGHQVSLAYTQKKISERYTSLDDGIYLENIKITGYRQLWDISKNYDLIHSHNEPDILTVAALAGDTPVIHDTHDLISLRHPGNPDLVYFEGIANRGAQGRIYSTPYQYEEAKQLYGVNGNALIFYNFASQDHVPREFLSKLSEKDGNIHFVYEGGIDRAGIHRDFGEQFLQLASGPVHVHIYPAQFDPAVQNLFSNNKNIHYYHPVPPSEIIGIMTQYDYGIIPWNLQKGNVRFLSSTIANKLFEYLAAGLPVATASISSYEKFFNEYPVGTTYQSMSDLLQKISVLQKLKNKTNFKDYIFTYESEIERLENYYYEILDGVKSQFRVKRTNRDFLAAKQHPPVTKDQHSTEKTLTEITTHAIKKLHNWIVDNWWAGYDPYDIKSYVLKERIAGRLDNNQAQNILNLDKLAPLEIRQKLGIEQRINAKAMGLFLGAYVDLNSLLEDHDFTPQITECSEWLLGNRASGIPGYGWGYPFDWDSVVMIPEGTPTGVNSYHIGDGFWKLWKNDKETKWMEVCSKIGEFFFRGLNYDLISEDKICFSYTPLDYYHVHNANLCVAEYLTRIGRETDNLEYQSLAEKAVTFSISDFSRGDYLTYWATGYEPVKNKIGFLDHYHSAAELRSLYRLSRLLPERSDILNAFEKYFDFYLRSFFTHEGIPKISPQSVYPVDIHAAAEAAYLLGEISGNYPKARKMLHQYISWFLNNMQKEDGSFIYQIDYMNGQFVRNEISYLRWGQAWTLRGLTSVLMGITR